MNSLSKFWKNGVQYDKDLGYFHREDKNALLSLKKNKCCYRTAKEFIESEGDPFKDQLHLGLYPSPYLGDLEKAKVVLGFLNPGFGIADYIVEEDAEFRKLLKDNLNNIFSKEYPYFTLDPKFLWTPASQWIHKKLNGVINKVKDKSKLSYWKAVSLISKRIASVELFPYHSSNFNLSTKTLNTFPSKVAANEAVIELLEKGEQLIIITRRANKDWGFSKKEYKNLIKYEGFEAQAASLKKYEDEIVKKLLE